MQPDQSLDNERSGFYPSGSGLAKYKPDWYWYRAIRRSHAASICAYYRVSSRHVKPVFEHTTSGSHFPRINRKIAELADLHFARPMNRMNLLREGVPDDQIVVTAILSSILNGSPLFPNPRSIRLLEKMGSTHPAASGCLVPPSA